MGFDIKKILKNPHLRESIYYSPYYISNFILEGIKHPILTARESYDSWIPGKDRQPSHGIRYENHCHSEYSYDCKIPLGDIIHYLMDKNVRIWSLTDHNNSHAFDAISNGEFDFDEANADHDNVDVEVNPDGRSLIIRSKDKQLVLLRSIEIYTKDGEIGIHGYQGNWFDQVGKDHNNRPTLEDAIMSGIDGGGTIHINHPRFWDGVGYKDRKNIDKAINIAVNYMGTEKCLAIEKNSAEGLLQVHSTVVAQVYAKEYKLPLVAASDAHKMNMYGRNGLIFNEKKFGDILSQKNGNYADAVKQMVGNNQFDIQFNYMPLLYMLKFLLPKESDRFDQEELMDRKGFRRKNRKLPKIKIRKNKVIKSLGKKMAPQRNLNPYMD